jgi:hypothetical protein
MKSKREIIAECNAQLEVLYDGLGKHLYENIENGRISFEFQNELLAKKAGKILDGMRAFFARQDLKPEPGKQIEPPAPEPGKPADSADLKRPRKSKPSKPSKVSKPTKSLKPERSIKRKEPATPEPEPEMSVESSDHRGSLERYTELMVELFDSKKKLLALKKDIEEYMSLTTVHLWDSASSGTDAAVRSLRVIEEEIISFIRNNMEAVQELMTRKKESAKIDLKGEYSDPAVLSGEIEFFNRASADIRHTSRQVEALVKNAVTLFEDIRRIYEEGVAADIQLKRDCGLLEEGGVKTRVSDAAGAADAVDAGTEDELLTEAAPQSARATTMAATAEAVMEDDPGPQEEDLLETAARKLTQINVAPGDKLKIFNTVLRSTPGRVASFTLGLLGDADMPIKKQLIDILTKIDNPALAGVYRKFLNSEDALVRMHGIIGLRRVCPADANDAIISAIDDQDTNVRRLVANCLDSLSVNLEVTAVVHLANDTDETVARIAIRRLGMIKSNMSFMQVLSKLDSPNEKIRKVSIDALKMMTGTDLGYKYNAPEPQRRVSVKSWQKLWKENQSNPRFLEEMKAGSRTRTAILARKTETVTAKKSKRSKNR